ncbi:MAG: hypothetical protein Q9186_004576 [Xanthomendoza sp. 1 TL-2023]
MKSLVETERLNGVFQLQLLSTRICTKCKHSKVVMEPQFEFVLPCQGKNDIDRALDNYFTTEEKEQIECASAKCKRKKVKKRYEKGIGRGPDLLCTLFNRFKEVNGKYRKTNSHIRFEEFLDLSRFVKNKTTLRYRLCAAIHHRGTKGRGHYISMARTPGGQWVRHDNEKVTPVSLEQVLHPTGSFTPYLLLWQKEKLESRKRPSSVHDENEPRAESSKRHKNSGRWRPSWLYGMPGFAPKLQQTSKDLSQHQEGNADLNEDVRKLEQLVKRAACMHKRLVDCTNYMNVGLDRAMQTLATISPLMQELKTKKNYRARATSFLDGEDFARQSRVNAIHLIERNERLMQLVQVDEGYQGERSNLALISFRRNFKSSSKDTQRYNLRKWLDMELSPDMREPVERGVNGELNVGNLESLARNALNATKANPLVEEVVDGEGDGDAAYDFCD